MHHPTTPQIKLNDYNLSITFSGWGANASNLFGLIPKKYPLAYCDSKKNYISVGGGGETGRWDKPAFNPTLWDDSVTSIITKAKACGYTGICFDLERGDDSATVENFSILFKKVKNAGLKVMVTISWFGTKTWGFTNMAALRESFIKDTLRVLNSYYVW